jgi:ADP-ribosylglycohydrolase
VTDPYPLDGAYTEKVYAGVLGKLIGVYLGRPVEGWPYGEIQERFGQVDHYVNDELGVPLIVVDDDISGTLAFARAVEDADGSAITPASFGATWLNYIIEDRTILWWGGFGRSTEHTAYLNLRRGVPAPASGSIAVNGRSLAEQIGAQILNDAFALMCPGDPEAAARLTRDAASVSHDGAAVECAAFFAAMRAAAFDEADLGRLIDTAKSIVTDDRLLFLIDDVTAHIDAGRDWRAMREWVDGRYGYARYPGPCHSLSNTAMSLAALYAAGDDFRSAVMIASSAGFDTDSNAGTVGCLNGVRLGLAAFDDVADLRAPIADRAIVVTADGGESITDASREARRIVVGANLLRGSRVGPAKPRFDFVLPGSVQGFQLCPYRTSTPGAWTRNLNATTGIDALTLHVPATGEASASTVTFLDPREAMTNFSTLASPTLYPTDTVRVDLSASRRCEVRLYVYYDLGGETAEECSEPFEVNSGVTAFGWEVPVRGNAVPFRLGVIASAVHLDDLDMNIHSMDWRGAPRHFTQSGILLSSIWDTKPHGLAPWVNSARHFEADFASTFSVSHPDDFGIVTTGTRSWRDYSVSSILTLSRHQTAGLVARARGHRRFVAGVFGSGRIQLLHQRDDERTVLAEGPSDYRLDVPYAVQLACVGDQVTWRIDGLDRLAASLPHPLGGGAGFLVEGGTTSADGFDVRDLSYQLPLHQKGTNE